MTDQVDVGWAAPPFGLKEIDEGKIRIVAQATDAAMVRGQTIRVLVANADALAKRKEVIASLHAGLSRDDRLSCIHRQSAGDERLCGIRQGFRNRWPSACATSSSPRALVDPDEIKGLDTLIPEAVTLKFISAPLTKEQIAELIQISPREVSRNRQAPP